MMDDRLEAHCEHEQTEKGFEAVDVELAEFVEALVGQRDRLPVFPFQYLAVIRGWTKL